MSESSRRAEVVPIEFSPHENADSLSIVKLGGFQCVVNTEQWKGHCTGVYIEPETIVKTTRSEFSFLKRDNRDKEIVRAKRLRGEWSVGLLVPTPEGFAVGDDCWEFLELEHYEPEEDVGGLLTGHSHPAPAYWSQLPKYDAENWRKYKYLFQPGEPISISEKINGANMSCVYSDGEYHVKSRNLWKKDDGSSDFWKALHESEPLKKYLRDHENQLVQGELTGKVKGFTYGLNGAVEFRAFDIRMPSYQYMDCIDFQEVCLQAGIRTPRLFAHKEPYSDELVLSHVDGEQEGNPKGIREGIVCKPIFERREYKLNGRLMLKCVSNAYLEKQGR